MNTPDQGPPRRFHPFAKKFEILLLCLSALALERARAQTLQYAFTNLAGISGGVGSVDGANGAARFWRPSGIAIDAAGYIYVADSFNHAIRKITPAGVVTTRAGA